MKERSVFAAWLASCRLAVTGGLVCAGLGLFLFWLYGLPWEAAGYLLCLCLVVVCLLAGASFVRFRRRHRTLTLLEEGILIDPANLPEAADLIQADYDRLLRRLLREGREQQARADSTLGELTGYYTLWVHQIKTPIAALDLLLQAGPEKTAEMEVELQKISQYVDMVLQYLRLDSEARDLVLRRCSLDEMVRQTVRKYAKLFILKKIRLTFQETGRTVLSDEKWFIFLLEQLLSNALKYTPAGGQITIGLEGEDTLLLMDTGIGIAPEDLPRVFDKGFTGQNGRVDRKATGLGLYLCRRTADLLGHSLTIDSRLGVGTQVRIGLGRPKFDIE